MFLSLLQGSVKWNWFLMGRRSLDTCTEKTCHFYPIDGRGFYTRWPTCRGWQRRQPTSSPSPRTPIVPLSPSNQLSHPPRILSPLSSSASHMVFLPLADVVWCSSYSRYSSTPTRERTSASWFFFWSRVCVRHGDGDGLGFERRLEEPPIRRHYREVNGIF